METLEQITAEQIRLSKLATKLHAVEREGYLAKMNVVRNDTGKIVSFEGYTDDLSEGFFSLERYLRDHGSFHPIVYPENITREKVKIRITIIDESEK